MLHDTAGLRKRAKAAGHELEQLSIASTLDAIQFADCVIVLIDATQPFEQQDLKIADLIGKEGRAIVFAINKWDLIEDRNKALKDLREKLDRLLPQVSGAGLVTVSALTGQGVDRLMSAVIEADRIWNTHVSTAALNRFLEDALARHPPPAIRGATCAHSLYDSTQGAATDLCPVWKSVECVAAILSALSSKHVARGLRIEGHAAQIRVARQQESLRQGLNFILGLACHGE